MTGTAIVYRASSLIALAVALCCANSILQAADAFQTRTADFRPISSSRQKVVTVQPMNDGRLFSTVSSAAAATNVTSELEENSKAFFSEPSSIRKRGRKRRAILRLREKRFSRPIESRIMRTLLFPMTIFMWKPLWKIMDISIARLDNDAEGVAVVESSDMEDSTVVSSEMKTVEVSSSDESKTQNTVLESSEETVSEVVDSQQFTAPIVESEPETISKEEVVSVKDTDDSVVAVADTPSGDRWAVAAPGVDLSGKWELIVTDDFKVEYDKYLAGLGQPKIVRSVALSGPVIGQTMEELIQIDQGKSLLIRGKNIRGTWDRTLIASGSTKNSPDFEPLITPIPTVDQEIVESEAWWEDQGKSHVSWMRGVTMYGGGSFYSRRYFEEKENEDDEDVYVCEGFFEFNDPKKARNELTWRFRRMAD